MGNFGVSWGSQAQNLQVDSVVFVGGDSQMVIPNAFGYP